ncbi:MAG: NACHT domain-containing protein [Oscillospiraceae bacterium]|nr:NACHT domain-containing protein [Oscillospiraceae bacterium]
MSYWINTVVNFFQENPIGFFILAACTVFPVIGGIFRYLYKNIKAIDNKKKLEEPLRIMLDDTVDYLNKLNRSTFFEDKWFEDPSVNIDFYDSPEFMTTISPMDSIGGFKSNEQIVENLNDRKKLFSLLFDKNESYNCKGFSKAFLKSKQRVVLLGEPGSGKSVTVRNHAIKIATKTLKGYSKDIPIYIPLSSWIKGNDKKQKMFDVFIEENLIKKYMFFADGKWSKYKKHIIFILDGVDELPRENDENSFYLNELKTWLGDNNVRYILTCRINDYNDDLGVNKVFVKPFNEILISKIIKKRMYGLHKKFELELMRNRQMYDLCKNPFILSLVCQYQASMSKKHQDNSLVFLPKNLMSMFEVVVEAILNKDENISKTLPKTLNSLEKLSYYMTAVLRQNSISFDELKDFQLYEYKYIFDICISVGILQIVDNMLVFSHHRYQEYFCACYLSKNKDKYPAELTTNIWWREIAIMVSQKNENIDDKNEFIEIILEEYNRLLDENTDENYNIVYEEKQFYQLVLAYECLIINRCDDKSLGFVRNTLFEYYTNDYEIAVIISISKKELYNETAKQYVLSIIHENEGFLSSEAFSALSENVSQGLRERISLFWNFFVECEIFSKLKRMYKSIKVLRSKSYLRAIVISIWFVFLLGLQGIIILYALYAIGFIQIFLFFVEFLPIAALGYSIFIFLTILIYANLNNTLYRINFVATILLGCSFLELFIEVPIIMSILFIYLFLLIFKLIIKFSLMLKIYLKSLYYCVCATILTSSTIFLVNAVFDVKKIDNFIIDLWTTNLWNFFLFFIVPNLIWFFSYLFKTALAIKFFKQQKIPEDTIGINDTIEILKFVIDKSNYERSSISTKLLIRYVIKCLDSHNLDNQIFLLKEINIHSKSSKFKDIITKIVISKEREKLRHDANQVNLV